MQDQAGAPTDRLKKPRRTDLLLPKNHAGSTERLSMTTGTPQGREEPMALLRSSPRSPRIRPLVELMAKAGQSFPA
jgi:hypothetical protein